MFAKDVLRILQVSRPTLTKYVKTGIIRVHVMPNGHTMIKIVTMNVYLRPHHVAQPPKHQRPKGPHHKACGKRSAKQRCKPSFHRAR